MAANASNVVPLQKDMDVEPKDNDARRASNLQFWRSVEKTNPKYTKKVKIGARQFTTIDAAYQMRNFTAEFGMYGVGWGIDNERFTYQMEIGHLLYQAELWFLDTTTETRCTIPMAAGFVFKNQDDRIDRDHVKKVRTDAFTKEISKMGFNADIFMGMFDDNKYVQAVSQEFVEENRTVANGYGAKAETHDVHPVILDQKPVQPVIPAEASQATTPVDAGPKSAPSPGDPKSIFLSYVDTLRQTITDKDYQAVCAIFKVQSHADLPEPMRKPFYQILKSYDHKDPVDKLKQAIQDKVASEGMQTVYDQMCQSLGIKSTRGLGEEQRDTIEHLYRSILFYSAMNQNAKASDI